MLTNMERAIFLLKNPTRTMISGCNIQQIVLQCLTVATRHLSSTKMKDRTLVKICKLCPNHNRTATILVSSQYFLLRTNSLLLPLGTHLARPNDAFYACLNSLYIGVLLMRIVWCGLFFLLVNRKMQTTVPPTFLLVDLANQVPPVILGYIREASVAFRISLHLWGLTECPRIFFQRLILVSVESMLYSAHLRLMIYLSLPF